MDRLASITAFVGVAETGGFSAAARRLSLSTTMVSNHVQALENALGVRLLNRTTRRVSLTEVGREYFERCAQILHELDEADEAASALQLTPRGQLRLYCHTGMARYIAPVITAFLTANPEVSVDMQTGDVLIDLVQEGYDLAISPVSPPDTTLIKRRLTGWRHVLCCTPGYLKGRPPLRRPADLVGHNCLRYTHSMFGDEWPFTDVAGRLNSVRVSGSLTTTSITTMRAVTVAGAGLWLSPPFIVADLLASGVLVPMLTDYRTPEMEIVALHPHRRHMTAKVRGFIDMLVERFADEQRWRQPSPCEP